MTSNCSDQVTCVDLLLRETTVQAEAGSQFCVTVLECNLGVAYIEGTGMRTSDLLEEAVPTCISKPHAGSPEPATQILLKCNLATLQIHAYVSLLRQLFAGL